MMRSLLADLALESEAAMAAAFRVSRAFDNAAAAATATTAATTAATAAGSGGVESDASRELAFLRIAVAVAKYYICKRAPAVAYEAMEALGGNGYIEVRRCL